jgi:hypothetical protein
MEGHSDEMFVIKDLPEAFARLALEMQRWWMPGVAAA